MTYTVMQLLRHPVRSFQRVDEPVAHGAVLRFLLALRLSLWPLVVVLCLYAVFSNAGPTPTALRPAHELLDPRLADAMTLWVLLLVPAGLPLLYFATGIFSHVALTLTGGAPRSIGATMRATGYAMAPALFLVSVLELLFVLGGVRFTVFAGFAASVWLLHFLQLGLALTGTHQIPRLRGFMVALIPSGGLVAGLVARAYLGLGDWPGWTPPAGTRFFVP
jgi:hypothetical protein